MLQSSFVWLVCFIVFGLRAIVGCANDDNDNPCDKVRITVTGSSASVDRSGFKSIRYSNFEYNNLGHVTGFDFVCGPYSGYVWYSQRIHI